ncbi:MAG: hypothetical protein WA220_13155 [Candidatus Nitrosopolaris sp.]
MKSKKQLTNIVLAISIVVGTIAVTAITMSMTTKFQGVNAWQTNKTYFHFLSVIHLVNTE